MVPPRIPRSADEAAAAAGEIGYPVILRPAFTLGGTGGGFAGDEAELRQMMKNALALSKQAGVLAMRISSKRRPTAILADTRAMGYPLALLARAEDRDTCWTTSAWAPTTGSSLLLSS